MGTSMSWNCIVHWMKASSLTHPLLHSLLSQCYPSPWRHSRVIASIAFVTTWNKSHSQQDISWDSSAFRFNKSMSHQQVSSWAAQFAAVLDYNFCKLCNNSIQWSGSTSPAEKGHDGSSWKWQQLPRWQVKRKGFTSMRLDSVVIMVIDLLCN